MPRLLGAKMRFLRKHGQPPLKQADLARLLGVSRGSINNVENGRDNLGLKKAVKLAVAFQVAADWLLLDELEIEDYDRYVSLQKRNEDLILRMFPAKILYQREALRWTQMDLAQAINVQSRSHISGLENGTDTPSVQTLIDLARAFRVSVDYLIFDDIPV